MSTTPSFNNSNLTYPTISRRRGPHPFRSLFNASRLPPWTVLVNSRTAGPSGARLFHRILRFGVSQGPPCWIHTTTPNRITACGTPPQDILFGLSFRRLIRNLQVTLSFS